MNFEQKKSHIDLETFNKIVEVIIESVDPLVTLQQAAELTGKSLHAIYCKISRSNIKMVHQRKLIRYSDAMKIKNKEI